MNTHKQVLLPLTLKTCLDRHSGVNIKVLNGSMIVNMFCQRVTLKFYVNILCSGISKSERGDNIFLEFLFK